MSDNFNKQKSIQNAEDLAERIKAGEHNEMDLSSDEDLSVAVMNLLSIEEHFFFTGAKTGQSEYYDLLQEVREKRKYLLAKLVRDPKGEEWCISKHLLAASMRIMEVGTKEQGRGRTEEARELFQKAFEIYSLFWGLNWGVVNSGEVTRIDEQAVSKEDPQPNGLMAKMGDLVKRAVNCCLE